MILEFLKNYQRMTVPSDDEIDVWVNSRPEPFPAELAKLRLPFHPLLKAQYIYQDSKLLTQVHLIPFWLVQAEIECTVHIALSIRPNNQFKPDQQSRQQAPKAYCSLTYILCLKALTNPKEMYQLLTNEFTIDSYQNWLNATSLFKIKPYIICTMAIKATVTKLCNDFKTSTPVGQDHWHTEAVISQEVLENIFACVEGIDDLTKANSAAFWTANRLPKGNEKLLVTRFLFKLNEAHGDASSKEFEFAAQMKMKLEVENILQKNFINKPSYLALVHKSSYEELIKQLFLHEYKNSKANKAAFDISNVVNEIMNEIINLTLIKYKLLDEWLPEEEDRSNSGNMDETMTNFNLIKSWQKEEKHDVNRENEENYWRCVNILQVSLYEY